MKDMGEGSSGSGCGKDSGNGRVDAVENSDNSFGENSFGENPGGDRFPLYYGSEAVSYSFYRVPKILFKSDVFRGLSTDARLLYGLLLDRMQLSVKNGWLDEDGRVYIYYPRQKIMDVLDCGNKKAGQLFAELDDKSGIGLITRVHQGLGKPDRIYVRKCACPSIPIRGSPAPEDAGAGPDGGWETGSDGQDGGSSTSAPISEVSKRHVQRCRNDTSDGVKRTRPEVSKGACNKTDFNKTERSKTDLIKSNPDVWAPGTAPARREGRSGTAGPGEAGHDENDGMDGFDGCDGFDGYDGSHPADSFSEAKALLEEYRVYREYFEHACCLDSVRAANPFRLDAIDEIRELLTETCCSKRPLIRAGGEDRPAEIVRSRFMKLDEGHIQYVLDCLARNTTKIRNIRQYLLTALYNAPATIDSYYTAEVNHDLYGDSSGTG